MALPVVRLAVVDAHKVTAVPDPRSASFTLYSFLKASAPKAELDACYRDFVRGIRGGEGGEMGAASSTSAAIRRVLNNTFRTAQSSRIVSSSEEVARTVFSKPPPSGLHPMGLSRYESRYLVEGEKGSEAAARERRCSIFRSFLEGGGKKVSVVGGGARKAQLTLDSKVKDEEDRLVTSPFAETKKPFSHEIPSEHFSYSPFAHKGMRGAGGIDSITSTPAIDKNVGRPDREELYHSSSPQRKEERQPHELSGGGGLTIHRGTRVEEDEAILSTINGAGGRGQRHGQSQDDHTPNKGGGDGRYVINSSSPMSPSTSPKGRSDPRTTATVKPNETALLSNTHAASHSSHLAAVIKLVSDGASAETLSSRDMAARNEREVWDNNAIDLYSRIESLRTSAGVSQASGAEYGGSHDSSSTTNPMTNDPKTIAAICDGLAARLRNVQLFHLLQRHEEETLQIADLAMRAECEAMKRQLKDVISALVRSESRLTGEDESLPPSDGRYVSEHFLFEQIQDVLNEASATI